MKNVVVGWTTLLDTECLKKLETLNFAAKE